MDYLLYSEIECPNCGSLDIKKQEILEGDADYIKEKWHCEECETTFIVTVIKVIEEFEVI